MIPSTDPPPRYVARLSTPAGERSVEVATFAGPDSAGQRAIAAAVNLGWGQAEEVELLTVTPAPEPA